MGVVQDTLGTAATGAWGAGVISSEDSTELAPNASPQGLNSALARSGLGLPFVQKRMGLTCLNQTPITGVPAINGAYQYSKLNGTKFFLLASAGGRLDQWTGTATATVDATAFTPSVASPPAFVTAQDVCYMCNGTDAIKFDGTTVTQFGITRPVVGTLAGAAGAAGLPNGTYALAVTYYNSVTGHESSLSDPSSANVVVTNQQISWSNIPVSGDAQVTDVRLYVRNINTQANFYQAGSVTNGTTTATTNTLDANLILTAPTVTSNNPPPAGINYLAYHNSRLFAATDSTLYYSAIGQPEAFDPLAFVNINPSDGQKITGIYSDHEVLLVFKEDRFYIITGDSDPTNWQVQLIDPETGCALGAFRTILSARSYTWWWSRHGLTRWDGSSQVDHIGLRLMGDTFDVVNGAAFVAASAAFSEPQQRLYFALPGVGQTRATFIIPFNVALDVFEATQWDPMDAATLAQGLDSNGDIQVYLGGYAGQFFQLWSSNNDGVMAGTMTGTIIPSGTTLTGVTDSGATFDITGGGLVERRVTLIDVNGFAMAVRPRITANTATTLTFDNTLTGLTPSSPYTYVIGGPNFQWDTPWRSFELAWVKKRYEFLFVLFKGPNYGTAAYVDMLFDYNDPGAKTVTFTTSAASQGALWDSAIWDTDVWDFTSNLQRRFRVSRTGFAHMIRVRNAAVNQPFALLLLGTQAVTQTVKT